VMLRGIWEEAGAKRRPTAPTATAM
jgi:hypothetical protein